jgi:hypothetical protein
MMHGTYSVEYRQELALARIMMTATDGHSSTEYILITELKC